MTQRTSGVKRRGSGTRSSVGSKMDRKLFIVSFFSFSCTHREADRAPVGWSVPAFKGHPEIAGWENGRSDCLERGPLAWRTVPCTPVDSASPADPFAAKREH